MTSAKTMVMSGMSGMAGVTQTVTGSAAMASSTGMSMGGGGMSMGGGCKISVRGIECEVWWTRLTRLVDVMELVHCRLLYVFLLPFERMILGID